MKHDLRLLPICLLAMLSVHCSTDNRNEAVTVRRAISFSAAAFPSYYADIFVFNDDRLCRLDTYQRMKVSNGAVDAVYTQGNKLVAVIINSGRDRSDWGKVDSFYALERVYNDIRNEDPDSPTMTGVGTMSRRDGEHIELDVTPLLAKVILKSIRCDFTGKPYENEKLTDARVYLTNVCARYPLLGGSGAAPIESINVGGLNPSDVASLKSPGMVSASLPPNIGNAKLSTGIELFCFPNSCREESAGARFTRLVVEGKIKGKTYYWPINVNRLPFGPVQGVSEGVMAGCCYEYDLVITRIGSMDPDVPVSPSSVELNCLIESWNEKEETVERF